MVPVAAADGRQQSKDEREYVQLLVTYHRLGAKIAGGCKMLDEVIGM